MKTIKDFTITGYLTLSRSFIKKQPEKNFFALLVHKGNPDFEIDDGAYLLCKITNNVKTNDLVVSEEYIKSEPIYSVHRYKKGRGFRLLKNSFGSTIVDSDWKPFGKVYKIFNIPKD